MLPDKVKLLPEPKRTFLEVGLNHPVSEQKPTTTQNQEELLVYKFAKMTSSDTAMLPSNKPKLSPESKQTLLEVALKHIIDEQESASKEQTKSLMYNFVKFLCVSKFYLYCSRRVNLDIYRISLLFVNSSDKIFVMISSKGYNLFGKNFIILTYDAVYKLLKILLPPYVGVYFSKCLVDENVFERYLKLLQLTNGEIGLYLHFSLKEQFAQTLLKAFDIRTYELLCSINQFEAVESLQFPVFDRLFVELIANFGQILRTFKFKAKELGFLGINGNFTIDDNDLVDLKNEAVKSLKLDFCEVSYVNIEKLAEQLYKSCVNLKDFDIGAMFRHYHFLRNSQIVDQIIVYNRHMEDLKTRFGNGLTSMSIKFKVLIYVGGRRNNNWIKDVCEKPELKHWKFKTSEGDLGDFCYGDTLEMKLDDAKYPLEMTVKMSTRDVEAENAAILNGN